MKTTTLLLLGIVCSFTAPSLCAAEAPATASVETSDAPCRIIERVKPQFPVRMIKNGVAHGTVRMLLHIDRTGQLADSLVTAYSRRAFADEVLRVLGRWQFTPARAAGEAVDTIVDLTFQFEVGEVLLVQKLSPEELPADERFTGFEFAATSFPKLDRIPTPLTVVEPTYPQEWRAAGRTGRVTVNFYIDEQGRARFPIVAAGTDEQLAGIALAAVQKWRFTPPQAQGKPVLVRARQVFAFGLD